MVEPLRHRQTKEAATDMFEPKATASHLDSTLDVVFHDDLARLRTGFGPQNMAVVKHIAMNLIRHPNDRHSLKNRRNSHV